MFWDTFKIIVLAVLTVLLFHLLLQLAQRRMLGHTGEIGIGLTAPHSSAQSPETFAAALPHAYANTPCAPTPIATTSAATTTSAAACLLQSPVDHVAKIQRPA